MEASGPLQGVLEGLRLTVKDRVLLHLLDFVKYVDTVEVPPAMTQEGIALASWIDDRHVPQNIRPLIREGLVRERTAHVTGGAQRRKVYDLTEPGRLAAIRLRNALTSETVQVRDASGSRESTVSQVVGEAGRTRPLLEIARQSVETGVVDLTTLGPPAGETRGLVLPEAVRLEREYNWLGAAEAYRGALAATAKDDLSKQGFLGERLGVASFQAAMQATQTDEFRERMRKALEILEAAEDAYSRSRDSRDTARVLRCRAMRAYMRFWLDNAIDERRKDLDEAWKSTRSVLEALESAGEAWEYGTTRNQLSLIPILLFSAEWDARSREPDLRDAIEHGERAIQGLSGFGDNRELAVTYGRTAWDLSLLAMRLAGVGEKEGLMRKAAEYWRKARTLCEETTLLIGPSFSSFEGTGTDETLRTCQKALDCVRRTKDRLLVGSALKALAYHRFWKSLTTEDLDEWRELLKKGLEESEEGGRHLATIAFGNIWGGSYMGECVRCEYNFELSRRERDPHVRYDLLRTALEAGQEGLRRARAFGFPDAIMGAHAPCFDTLEALGELEEDTSKKRKWLQEALDHAHVLDHILEQNRPAEYFGRGDFKIGYAQIRFQLAGLADTLEARLELLREAARNAEEGLNLCIRDMSVYERQTGEVSGYAYIGYYASNAADPYMNIFELTGDKACLLRAAEMVARVADLFRKSNLPSRVAECHWRAGKIHDAREDHQRAAEEFSLASTIYKSAAERVPQLTDFYRDLALYMQAWSEIEKARYHHRRAEYGLAREYYERAATLHGFSRAWGFMAPNYAAWAQLEGAEELSRTEKGAEAIGAFGRASELFREARITLEGALDRIQVSDERKMVDSLIRAAERRSRYCRARIALEEARVLDKKGEYSSSSRRYGEVADAFEKLVADADSERDRTDLSLIATLAKAWEAMARAEADALPEWYAEAARLFESARELSSSEKAKALAMGQSRFCQALEAGTRFADARDPVMHASAIRHLESAAGHYAQAGAESASEYATANKRLFDAYVSMDRADQEKDHEKKARAFLVVEKILEASAASFRKAGYPGKRDQVLRVLENVKRERELEASLMEVFRAPLIVSSMAAFAPPAASFEQAVGMEELEHADIRASLTPSPRTLAVGEELELKIGFVNAGRAPGQLIQLENLVPRDFEIAARPARYDVEEGSLNLKGRRLEPLRAELVRIVLRPRAKGVFAMKPRVTYLDETGSQKWHEPESVDVKVTD